MKKTCQELAKYALRPDGKYDLRTDMVVSLEPRIVMTWRGLVYVRNSMICSVLKRADFETTTFIVDGQPAGAEFAYEIRQAMRPPGEDERLDHESCLTITARDGQFFEDYFRDGNPDSDHKSVPMLWVSQDEGYRLGP